MLDFKGKSMGPTPKEGDRVIIKPVKSEDVKTGDIIVFGKRELACHRVMGRVRKDGVLYFWEKGDNTGGLNLVPEDYVVGKAVFVVREGNIQRPGFYITKARIFLYILDVLTYLHIKTSKIIKKYVFLQRDSVILRILGRITWKIHTIFFNIIKKN
ncbi:MAG: S26 family signal peptidase [Candidatus Omnitrophica bacterium]|nr:S26 family signal peptidase [Candidatus Omnitrophota bacterium]MBU4589766.1 S26 family signal peptidase [Candidatus Omnitrophota bacterium]